jgi:hypothetical protein
MNLGDVVRPVVSLAGLDSRQQYRVEHLEETFLTTIAYLRDASGALHPVENAHTFVEVVKSMPRTPSTLFPA